MQGRFVSANYLTAGGLHCTIGRTFTPEEERTGSPAVAVLDYGVWNKQFSGNPDVLGKTIVLNGRPLVVVGVSDSAPDRCRSSICPSHYNPLSCNRVIGFHDSDQRLAQRRKAWLRPGISVRQSQGPRATCSPALAHAEENRLLVSAGGPNPWKRREITALVVAITVAVSMILLIACSNLANLLLARAVVRRREIGVRLSLGASGLRLISQLILTESMLLSLAGSALGLILAYWLAKNALLLVNAVSPGSLLTYPRRPASGPLWRLSLRRHWPLLRPRPRARCH